MSTATFVIPRLDFPDSGYWIAASIVRQLVNDTESSREKNAKYCFIDFLKMKVKLLREQFFFGWNWKILKNSLPTWL